MSALARMWRESVVVRCVAVGLLLLPALAARVVVGARQRDIPTVIHEASLPDSVGDWLGVGEPLTKDELSLLQSPASSQKIYQNTRTGDRVQVMLLQVNNTQNAHDPRICMTGAGYGIGSEAVESADWIGRSGREYSISRDVFVKDGTALTMFYWVQTPTGTIADMSAGFKLEGAWRALQGQATKGIAVRVVCLTSRSGPQDPTPPTAGIRLWKELDRVVDIEALVKRM